MNVSVLSLGTSVQAFSLFLLFALIGRYLSVQQFGEFTIASNFAAIVMPIARLGIEVLIVREISRNPQLTTEYTGQFLLVRCITILILVPVAYITARFLYDQQQGVLGLIPLLLIKESFLLITNGIFAVFRAHQQMWYEALTNIVVSLLQLCICLFVLEISPSISNIAITITLTECIRITAAWYFYVKEFSWPQYKLTQRIMRLIWTDGIALSFAGIFVMVYTKSDVLILSYFRGATEVGNYGAAYKILTALTLISSSILPAIYPKLAQSYIDNITRFRKILTSSFFLIVVLAILISLILSLFAPSIIFSVYGSKFLEATDIMKILSWALPFIFVEYLCNVSLNAMNRTKANAIVAFICMVFNLLANWYFVPRYGYIATSISTILTECLVMVIGLVLILKYLREHVPTISLQGKEQ